VATQNATVVDDATRFFGLACEAFRRTAEASGGTVDRFYRVAGHNVRLCFTDKLLLQLLTPALAHLEINLSSGVELTIFVWDSDSISSDRVPLPPWSPEQYSARGEVRGVEGRQIHVGFHSNTLSMLDERSNLGLYWVRGANQLTYTESGSPFIRMFHWWMHVHRKQLVHAGAVGTAKGGVLLAGKGGSGKSTTCLLCLDTQLSYVGDDYCMISTRDVPYVYSLYSSGKVDAQNVGRLPFLRVALSNPERLDTEKALFFLNDHFSNKLIAGFPLRAVLLPRVTKQAETKLCQISASASLLALAPSTIFQLPGAGPDALTTLGELVRRMPSYILELGTNISQIPDTILNLLDELK
jgi:hypothetical protein